MKIGISALMWWFFAVLLTATVKLGLDNLLQITSADLWGSMATTTIAVAFGFGIVMLFRRHVSRTVTVVGAAT